MRRYQLQLGRDAMKLMLTVALSALLTTSVLGQATANSISYYEQSNHYSSNCDTPSRAC
jgi:hypothetical protein